MHCQILSNLIWGGQRLTKVVHKGEESIADIPSRFKEGGKKVYLVGSRWRNEEKMLENEKSNSCFERN